MGLTITFELNLMYSNMIPWFLGLNNFIILIVLMKFILMSHILPYLTQNGTGQTVVCSKTGIIAEASINRT